MVQESIPIPLHVDDRGCLVSDHSASTFHVYGMKEAMESLGAQISRRKSRSFQRLIGPPKFVQ